MGARVRVSDLDFVYISYLEPNREENWADLKNKVPWAKRVDGVVGFDSAHKAAAEKAETDFFISVDGDNIIDERFLLETLDWTKTDPKAVHRWRARNNINNLVYGNGGLVGWPRETCLQMETHENAKDKRAEIDFCWTVAHENLHNCYSTTVINASASQAFIAGYREGVKMSLDQGKRVAPANFVKDIWRGNLRNLCMWMSVGADVKNGLWAIYGACQGCLWTTLQQEWDHSITRDFTELDNIWDQTIDQGDDSRKTAIKEMHNDLNYHLGLNVALLDEEQSKFVKFINSCPATT